VEALERKRDFGTWTETLIIQESNSLYATDDTSSSQEPITGTPLHAQRHTAGEHR
jgi:hypothetical protein